MQVTSVAGENATVATTLDGAATVMVELRTYDGEWKVYEVNE